MSELPSSPITLVRPTPSPPTAAPPLGRKRTSSEDRGKVRSISDRFMLRAESPELVEVRAAKEAVQRERNAEVAKLLAYTGKIHKRVSEMNSTDHIAKGDIQIG